MWEWSKKQLSIIVCHFICRWNGKKWKISGGVVLLYGRGVTILQIKNLREKENPAHIVSDVIQQFHAYCPIRLLVKFQICFLHNFGLMSFLCTDDSKSLTTTPNQLGSQNKPQNK